MNKKSVIFYVAGVGLFAALFYLLLHLSGQRLSLLGSGDFMSSMQVAFSFFSKSIATHVYSSIGILLLQIFVILLACRLAGKIMTWMKQPAVVGEILVGILFGPSFLGYFYPSGFHFLFHGDSLKYLELLSEVGLILFMFTIGMELNLSELKKDFSKTVIIAHMGIMVPFIIGGFFALYTFPQYGQGGSFLSYLLFIGIAMSVTAFPVLARIIQEHKLQSQPLGKLTLGTAAVGDITAWLLMAIAMAITQSGSLLSAIYNFLFLVLFLLIVFLVIRPIFGLIGKIYTTNEVFTKPMVGVIFLLVIMAAYFTEILSMHALFGAFIIGLVMPDNLKFRSVLTEKIEDVSHSFFLPLFFVAAGLEVQFGLINSPYLWALVGCFILASIIGKVSGTYLSARVVGISKIESLYLGAFMNTQGLMGLVVLAIGFDAGVLSPTIYSIIMLSTVVVTFLTNPLIFAIQKVSNKMEQRKKHAIAFPRPDRVLLAFGRPSSGVRLLHLTNLIYRKGAINPIATALHITPRTDLNPIEVEVFRKDAFKPIMKENEQLEIDLETNYIISSKVEGTIVSELQRGNYGMLIVGAGLNLSDDRIDHTTMEKRRKYEQRFGTFSVSVTEVLLSGHQLIRDKMAYFIERAQASVGIFVDRHFVGQAKSILVMVSTEDDLRMLPYARNLKKNMVGEDSRIFVHPIKKALQLEGKLQEDECVTNTFFSVQSHINENYDFMFVSYDTWQTFFAKNPELIAHIPPSLILHLYSIS